MRATKMLLRQGVFNKGVRNTSPIPEERTPQQERPAKNLLDHWYNPYEPDALKYINERKNKLKGPWERLEDEERDDISNPFNYN